MELQKLMARGEARLSDSLLSLIKKKQDEKDFETELGLDVKWRVFNGKLNNSENIIETFLSKVVDIFHVSILCFLCFTLVVDFLMDLIKWIARFY